MPSKLDPFIRLFRLLRKAPRFRDAGDAVERAFARSMRNRQLQEALSRKMVRRLPGSQYTVKGDPSRVQRLIRATKGGGRVTSHWNYRRSLGHLTEDAAARSPAGRKFPFTNPNKDTNRPGIDLAHLSFDKRGRFVITASDVKGQQAAGNINSVSALTRNLIKNLQDERGRALAAARDKARPYGERVYFRSVSMAINKVLSSNPNSRARSIRAAIRQGTLRLEVRNDGGNATGVSKALKKFGLIFDDRRQFRNGMPVVNRFLHGLIPQQIRKQFGLSGNTTMKRFPSRHAELSRRRGTPSDFKMIGVQSAVERFRARLAAGSKPQAKPARPVGTRAPAKNAAGQNAARPVGTRSAGKATSGPSGRVKAQAKSFGPRPARPSGGSGGLSRTKGGAGSGSKTPQSPPVYRPYGRPYGHV
jgi:hypothetical protein